MCSVARLADFLSSWDTFKGKKNTLDRILAALLTFGRFFVYLIVKITHINTHTQTDFFSYFRYKSKRIFKLNRDINLA